MTLCSLTFVIASAHLGQAQFAPAAGTNAYNFADYNNTPSASDGTHLTAIYTGLPVKFASVAPISPGPTITTSDPIFAATAPGALAQASGNIGGGATPYGNGITVTLDNPNPGEAAEVRLDWFSTFTYTGGSFPLTGITATITGSTTGSYALAGGETIDDNGIFSTATLPGNGYGDTVPLSLGTWLGVVNNGPVNASETGLFSPMIIHTGDTIEVQGFLDLVADPGSVQVELSAVPEPSTNALIIFGCAALVCGYRKIKAMSDNITSASLKIGEK